MILSGIIHGLRGGASINVEYVGIEYWQQFPNPIILQEIMF